MKGWMDEGGERMDEWMDGWTNRWRGDEWMDEGDE